VLLITMARDLEMTRMQGKGILMLSYISNVVCVYIWIPFNWMGLFVSCLMIYCTCTKFHYYCVI
jgi:hypothetical protein